jgi:Membrane bound FAD containing D-sorbitol dehydrogenase
MKRKNNRQELSRRRFITIGSIATLGALVLERFSWPDDIEILPKPEYYGQKKPSLNENEFFIFSKYLLNDKELDRDFSKKIYTFFRKSKSEFYDFYEYLRLHPTTESSQIKKYLQENKKFQKAYYQIAVSWYTGVFVLGKSSMRFSYFDAYMFKNIGGLAPTPGTCGGATNYWSEKPSV